MTTPIGIDLGTTFSVICCYRNGIVEIISDDHDERLIPSMVYYDPYSGDVYVGKQAYEKSREYPPNLLKDAKRIIGRKFGDELIKKWFQPGVLRSQICETETGMAAFQVEINGEVVLKTPEEVSSNILKYLMNYASEYLGESVKEAVVSIPAYFSGSQRKATLKAAKLAGLKVLKLISEPVAGALHYVVDRKIKWKVVVVDFGGGTLDVSLIEVSDRGFEVKGVCGDTMLGGRNIDENIFKHFYTPAKNKLEKNVLRNIRRLEENCISMKEYLSKSRTVTKIIECYDADIDLKLQLDIETFEELNRDIFKQTIDLVHLSLKNVGWETEEIERVILIGGSTRIPKIRQLLKNIFGFEKIKTDVNPSEAVARGACLQAAIFGSYIANLEKYEVCEVTPLSIGISCYGDLTYIVIPKNSKLPACGGSTLKTIENDQRACTFDIIEGERKNAKYNNQLGSFCIKDLPLKKAGDVSFTVTFSLDEDGILTVTGTENSTGQNERLIVTMGEFRLSEHQIIHNIEESRKHKDEDDMYEKFINKRNRLIKQCHHWMYKNVDHDRQQNCKDFIKYAEELDYKLMDDLNDNFKELEMKYGV